MGIDYGVCLAVGKQFEDDSEVMDFLKEAGIAFSDEDLESMEESSVSDFLYYGCDQLPGFKCEVLNSYDGWGRVLGIPLVLEPAESFATRVQLAQEDFRKIFKSEPEIICQATIS